MLKKAKDLLTGSPTLPMRKGKRPVTIRGPLHVQCSNHGDDRLLRQLVKEVVAWPGIEPNPLPSPVRIWYRSRSARTSQTTIFLPSLPVGSLEEFTSARQPFILHCR